MSKENKEQATVFAEKLGIHLVTLQTAKQFCKVCFQLGYIPTLVGESGIGKTALMRQIAEEEGADIYFLYLAHMEKEDFGIPFPNKNKSAYVYLTEEHIAKLADTEKVTYLILDEWNRGSHDVMNAAFTLMEQRRFGSVVLPKNIRIGATMNPSEMGYLVNECEKDPAFRRRLAWIGVRSDPGTWLSWAKNNKIHESVMKYIIHNPAKLLDVETRDAGKVYANPAAWEKVSRIMYDIKNIDNNTLSIVISGFLGIHTATEFTEWLETQKDLVSPEDVLRNYNSVRSKIKELIQDSTKKATLFRIAEATVLWLVSNEYIDASLGDNLSAFIEDLPEEIQMAMLTKLVKELQERRGYMDKLLQQLAASARYKQLYAKLRSTQEEIRKSFEKDEN